MSDAADAQAKLDEYVSETPTETVETTRTVKFKLETSQRKLDYLRECIDIWQPIAARMAELLPSFPTAVWGETHNTQLTYAAKREFPEVFEENQLKAHHAYEAARKVTEAFGSWDSNGREGERPQFGDGSYLRFCHCGIDIESNDRGYGAKLSLVPYNPEWFHLDVGDYQREYLEGIVDGEYDAGGGEVHVTDDGEAFLHQTLTTEVEVYEPTAVPRYVGVDIGETVLYAVSAVEPGDERDDLSVVDVEMENGREFRHHREQLKQKRQRLQEQDDLRGVRAVRGEHERYTDHVLGRASRRVVDFAVEHAPCAIVLEDLTDYRETAADPIHDFPYAQLRERISYKATDEGIPVVTVEPAGTSTTCRKCGQRDPSYRDGTDFECRRCGYEVHADVNAAINIGRALESDDFERA